MPRITAYVDDEGRTWLDDPSIVDDDVLLRRIPPEQIVPDHNTGGVRPSSGAFCDDGQGHPMSVYLTSRINELGLDPQLVLEGHEGFAVAGIGAAPVRDEEQVLVREHTPDDPPHVCDPAHGLVAGKKPRSRRGRVWKHAYWVVPPTGD